MKTIEDIEKQAKELVEDNCFIPMLLTEDTLVRLGFTNDAGKEYIRQKARKLIQEKQIKKYWTAFMAWFSSSNPFVRPKYNWDRRDGLMISEYDGITMKNKAIFIPLAWKNGRVVWRPKEILPIEEGRCIDAWNFYLEDVAQEKVSKQLEKDANEFVERSISKSVITDMVQRYEKDTGEKTSPEEVKETLVKMMMKGTITPTNKGYQKFAKDRKRNQQ